MQKREEQGGLLVQPITYFVVFGAGLLLRWFCADHIAITVLQKYAPFNTPLIDVRDLKEQFYMYEKTGEFFSSPQQVS